MEYVDTHCHIQSAGGGDGERSTADIWAKYPAVTASSLVQSATKAGISRLVCIGCDLPDSQLAISCAQSYPGVWSSIGLHPHEAARYVEDVQALKTFASLAAEPSVVAVGECGLDYYYEHSPKASQIKILQFQIELALEHGMPIIFHVRDAFDDFWPIFDSYKGITGVLHSFTDSQANMERAVANGLYIGVNGIATFSKQPEQLAMYKAIPLDNLVLETDAPFLTPTPYRGKVNEPKHVATIAAYLSDLYQIDQASLATATTANAVSLFGLK